MAGRQRGPGRTTPTRQFPLQPPPDGTAGGLTRWMGAAAIAAGLLLCGLAFAVTSVAFQQVIVLLLGLLLLGTLFVCASALREAMDGRVVPTWLWTLIVGMVVVALALGLSVGRVL